MDVKIERSGLISAVIGGISSILIAVFGGVSTQYFIEKRPRLIYSITAMEDFSSEIEKVGFVTINVANSGSKEIEDLECHVTLIGSELKDAKVSGLAAGSVNLKKSKAQLDVSSKFVNEGESFTIQLLVALQSNKRDLPIISLRGKGAVGALQRPQETNKSYGLLSTVIVAIIAVIAQQIISLYIFKNGISFLPGRRHPFGYNFQRDQFAHLLMVNRFYEMANIVYHFNRSISLWALSDWFTGQLRQLNDANMFNSGVNVLNKAIEIKGTDSMTKAIILTNMCKLAILGNSTGNARSYMKKAKEVDSATTSLRVNTDVNIFLGYEI